MATCNFFVVEMLKCGKPCFPYFNIPEYRVNRYWPAQSAFLIKAKIIYIYIVVEMWECGKRQSCFPYFHTFILTFTTCYSWFSHNTLFGSPEAASTIFLTYIYIQRGSRRTLRSDFIGKGYYFITPNKYVWPVVSRAQRRHANFLATATIAFFLLPVFLHTF